MKLFASTLAVLAVTVTLAAAERLFQYVPAGAEYLIGVDAATLQKQPFFQDLKQNPNFSNLLGEGFERSYGVKLEECDQLIFAAGGKQLRATLATTSLAEETLKTRLKALGDRFSLESEAGFPLYCLLSDDSIPATRITLALAYLKNDVVMVTEREYVKPYFAAITTPAETRRAAVTLPKDKPLAWSYIDFKKMFSGKKKNQMSFFFNGVRNAFLELNLAGKGWTITGTAQCKDSGSANQFSFMFPSFLQLASGWVFGQDPALGQEFLKQLSVYPEGDQVKLRLEVPETLGKKLAVYLKEQGSQILIPPDPVPADQKPAGRSTE